MPQWNSLPFDFLHERRSCRTSRTVLLRKDCPQPKRIHLCKCTRRHKRNLSIQTTLKPRCAFLMAFSSLPLERLHPLHQSPATRPSGILRLFFAELQRCRSHPLEIVLSNVSFERTKREQRQRGRKTERISELPISEKEPRSEREEAPRSNAKREANARNLNSSSRRRGLQQFPLWFCLPVLLSLQTMRHRRSRQNFRRARPA